MSTGVWYAREGKRDDPQFEVLNDSHILLKTELDKLRAEREPIVIDLSAKNITFFKQCLSENETLNIQSAKLLSAMRSEFDFEFDLDGYVSQLRAGFTKIRNRLIPD